MRCSTCGENLAPDDDRCPTCGAAAASVALRPSVAVRRCPRCHYSGEGVGYFRRPGHVALLVCLSLFTYGFGGLVYWLVRRRHLVCPNCGFGWENASRLLSSGDRSRALPGSAGSEEREPSLPSAGVKRRVLGTMAILFGAFLIMMGIIEFEAAAIAVGSVVGAGGSGTFYWGWKALQDRRAALTQGLQRRVLRLATQKGGTLTVTEVAAELDLSIPAAEKVLVAMDDGFRVRSEITREGILLYEFPEVQHRGRLGPGAAS